MGRRKQIQVEFLEITKEKTRRIFSFQLDHDDDDKTFEHFFFFFWLIKIFQRKETE